MSKATVGLTSINTIPAKFLDCFLPMLFRTIDCGIEVSVATKHHYFTDLARNACVETALNENSDYLFFLDADVFVPPNILVALIERNVDIISGPYHQKTAPFHPVAYKENSDGTYSKEKILEKKLFEVDAVGAGCLLIKTKILKEIGYPWFSRILPNEQSEHSKELKFERKKGLGEDMYFCKKAKLKGLKIFYDNTIEGVQHYGAPVEYEMYKKFIENKD